MSKNSFTKIPKIPLTNGSRGKWEALASSLLIPRLPCSFWATPQLSPQLLPYVHLHTLSAPDLYWWCAVQCTSGCHGNGSNNLNRYLGCGASYVFLKGISIYSDLGQISSLNLHLIQQSNAQYSNHIYITDSEGVARCSWSNIPHSRGLGFPE